MLTTLNTQFPNNKVQILLHILRKLSIDAISPKTRKCNTTKIHTLTVYILKRVLCKCKEDANVIHVTNNT